MKSTDLPVKHPIIFGTNGKRTSTGIPETVDPALGVFSLDVGIADINMIPLEAQGIPPKGQDFNQILYEIDGANRWMQAGGPVLFDSAFCTKIGGYPKGALITGNDYKTLWRSTVEDNTNDPNNNPTGWELQVTPASDLLTQIVQSGDTTHAPSGNAVYNAILDMAIPVGVILPIMTDDIPSGFALCDGQSFDKFKYPKCAKIWPSGNLPDLRGEFLRGADPGSSRFVGSTQSDAMQNITGSFGAGIDTSSGQAWSGAFYHYGSAGGGSAGGSHPAFYGYFESSRVVRTDTETRPRNVAVNYITRLA